MSRTRITRDEIMPMAAYSAIRRERRRQIAAEKRNRRVDVGPHATFYFESYETMWFQVHEMLAIEGDGEERIKDELADYNPLIPQGRELVATVIFECDDPVCRDELLRKLATVGQTMAISIGDERVVGQAERERDHADAVAPWVHFIRFGFTPEQIAGFGTPGAQVTVSIDHPDYCHESIMPETMRDALAGDFFEAA